MFRFAHPEYLYLLLAAPALIALFAWALYDRRRRLARFGDPATVATLMPDASTGRMKLKFILFTPHGRSLARSCASRRARASR